MTWTITQDVTELNLTVQFDGVEVVLQPIMIVTQGVMLITVELVDLLTVDMYFPNAGSIDTELRIFGTGTLAIEKNDVAYTLGGAIAQGDKITFTASAASVWNLGVHYD